MPDKLRNDGAVATATAHCFSCAVQSALLATSTPTPESDDDERGNTPCPVFFLPDEIGAYLRVSTKVLERWRRYGGGPPWRKFGGAIRYPAAGLAAWLADKSQESQPA